MGSRLENNEHWLMIPMGAMSQHTPCAYKGNLARGNCVPLRTPTAARLSPARGRAGGVAPLPPGGAPTADSPHRGCRRPRVVGEARRPAGAAGVACARPWLGRRCPSGRGGAVVPVTGATTVLPLLSLLRIELSPAGDAKPSGASRPNLRTRTWVWGPQSLTNHSPRTRTFSHDAALVLPTKDQSMAERSLTKAALVEEVAQMRVALRPVSGSGPYSGAGAAL